MYQGNNGQQGGPFTDLVTFLAIIGLLTILGLGFWLGSVVTQFLNANGF